MRKTFFILISLFGVIFVINCTSMNNAYLKAISENSVKGYERFLKRYPQSFHAEDVRKRIEFLKEERSFPEAEAINSTAAYTSFYQRFPSSIYAEEARKRASSSDREAFMNACELGTVSAFQGFMESRPASRYYPLASSRIDFLKAAGTGDLKTYKQFIAQYPNNPFVPEAIASYPVLWLDRMGMRVGVIINVGDFVRWKGLLHGRHATRDEVRKSAFIRLQKDAGGFGDRLTLLDSPEDAKTESPPLILFMEYSEKGVPAESMAQALHDMLTGPPKTTSVTMSITDAENGFVYYSNVGDLAARADRAATMKALCAFREKVVLSPLIVALNDMDPHIRTKAAEALKQVTGQDFKDDGAKWCELWERGSP